MKTLRCLLLATVFIGTTGLLPAQAQNQVTVPDPPATEEPTTVADPVASIKPTLEVVFCIDCSGSMFALMPQAKQAIRTILKEQANSYQLHLGLIRYGDADRRYFVQDLSDNEDLFFKNLDATQGGAGSVEFFGTAVLKAACLNWQTDGKAKRCIVIVGNETAVQGPDDYRQVARAVAANGISLNTFYCNNALEDNLVATAQRAVNTRVVNRFGGYQALPGAQMGQRILADQLTWLYAAYLGGGDCYKLSSQSGHLYDYYPNTEVRRLIDIELPKRQAEAQIMDAKFKAMERRRQ